MSRSLNIYRNVWNTGKQSNSPLKQFTLIRNLFLPVLQFSIVGTSVPSSRNKEFPLNSHHFDIKIKNKMKVEDPIFLYLNIQIKNLSQQIQEFIQLYITKTALSTRHEPNNKKKLNKYCHQMTSFVDYTLASVAVATAEINETKIIKRIISKLIYKFIFKLTSFYFYILFFAKFAKPKIINLIRFHWEIILFIIYI